MFTTASHAVTSCSAGSAKSDPKEPVGSKFRMKASVQMQLRSFAHLRAEDPVQAKMKYDRGEMLVTLAQHGKFMKLTQLIHGIEEGDVLSGVGELILEGPTLFPH